MKKLIFVLALLLMAAPAMAAIELNFEEWEGWVDDDPNFGWNEGMLSYDVNGENIPRAFAIEVQLDDPNFEIDWIWREGDGGDAYWVTPTHIDIGDGEVLEWGPAWGELDGDYAVIEMASLYAEGEAGPPSEAGLCGIAVVGPAGETVCLDFAVEPVRGGVIDESLNPLEIDPNGPICLTMASPGPECWDYPCFGCGDADGSDSVGSADAVVLISAWPPKTYNPCADFDQSGGVGSADAVILINHWPPKESCPAIEGCQ
jgi:hypothetical protein